MSRKTIVAANWKLNKGPSEASSYFEEFFQMTPEESDDSFLFFLPAIDLLAAQSQLQDTKVGWGAQNIYFENSGAFTGENSAEVCKEVGCTHVLVGHSERRSLFGESNEAVCKKIKHAQKNNLIPVLCIGETLEQREAGETNNVLKKQLVEGLMGVDDLKNLVIAYEPVWAIGTGKVATPEMANEAHHYVRSVLAELHQGLGDCVSILYGGSVKPENAKELYSQQDIDGFLVGGASLKPDSFYKIFEATL